MTGKDAALARSAPMKLPKLTLAHGRYVTRGAPRSGGLAAVYLAADTETGESVAVKVFRSTGAPDDVIEESFRREVQALSEIKHPHVIRIHDFGRDDDQGVHYLVMDWVAQDLRSRFLSQEPHQPAFTDWDSYYDTVGRPVLEALAFAHSRGVAHRDVKPSNVLVTPEGQIRLCDFGISKVRNFLAPPGVTLAHFTSEPFSPPEPDDGSHSYSRDVYAFAVLSLSLLAATKLRTTADVQQALETVALTADVREVLSSCLSPEDPSDRPQMASLLLAMFLKTSPAPQRPSPVVLLATTRAVRMTLEHDLALTGNDADSFVMEDLAQATGEQEPDHPERPEWGIRLYGSRYGYIGRMDETRTKIVLVSARDYSVSELERKAKQAFDLGARLGFAGASAHSSGLAFDTMREQLAAAQELRTPGAPSSTTFEQLEGARAE